MNGKAYIITSTISAILVAIIFLGFGLLSKSMGKSRLELAEARAREQQYEALYNGARAELASARTEIEESRKLLGTIRESTNKVRESISRNDQTIGDMRETVKDLQNYYSGIEQCFANNNIAINR